MTTTLLAVDDSKTLRKVFEITFAGEPQFQVVLAQTAADALGKLQGTSPKVALVDVTLPDQNGYDLCTQIKAQSPGTAVLILSSKQQPYDAARGSAAGADDFIDKPFDSQQLIDKVTQLSTGAAPAVNLSATQISPQVSLPRPGSQKPAAVAQPAASQKPQAQRRIQSVPPPKPKSFTPPVYRPDAGLAASASAAGAVAATHIGGGLSAEQLQNLGLSPAQVEAVMALSRDVVERVVWEVVPVLAETLIREEIRRLTAE